MKAIYREQGNKLYKLKGNDLLEINLESYEYGVIGIIHADMRTCPMNVPNKYASTIAKAEFDKYYKEEMEKIKQAYKA